ncbi:MAG: hypothetical protein WBE72_07320 [Terracidiphilus sp.]
MEQTLNLAWALLAIALVSLWLRLDRGAPSDRRAQLVALAVLLFILLPAISMTDDLLAAQNPAEIDSCLRRDQVSSGPHPVFLAVAVPPPPAYDGLPFGIPRLTAPGTLLPPAVEPPGLAAIQNRPPPRA